MTDLARLKAIEAIQGDESLAFLAIGRQFFALPGSSLARTFCLLGLLLRLRRNLTPPQEPCEPSRAARYATL